MKRVAIQGQQASYHDIAAHQFFGDDIAIVGCEVFADVFSALQNDTADVGLIAIENSLYGSINKVYDLLLRHKFWVSGEVYLRINHCLIGLPGAKLHDIGSVHSQLEALAQCEEFLDTSLPQAERHEHHDTAASVAAVKQWNDPTKAAIASKAAAELHGMQILAEDIETNKQNYTRFLALGKTKTAPEGCNKTSLVLVTDHKPGALHQALGAFAQRGINLSKLQSRPIVGEAWHYMFYIDVGAGIQDAPLTAALDDLRQQNCEASVLGSYQDGRHTSS